MAVRKLTISVLAALGVAALAFAAEVPRKAPDFMVHMPDGKDMPLSRFHDKVCVVAFISTTCPHCQHYVQILNGINKDYAGKGVQIVAVGFNDVAKTAIPGFIQQFQPTFPIGWQEHAQALGFMQISVINPGFVPKVVFIDRSGTIRKQYDGQDDFFKDPDKSTRAALDDMLKTPMAQHKTVKTVTKQ